MAYITFGITDILENVDTDHQFVSAMSIQQRPRQMELELKHFPLGIANLLVHYKMSDKNIICLSF